MPHSKTNLSKATYWRYVFTYWSYPNHRGFFFFLVETSGESKVLWPLQVLWEIDVSVLSLTDQNLWRNILQNFLLGALICPGVSPVCHNVQSLSAWLANTTSSALLSYCFTEHSNEPCCVLFPLKWIRWICLYQNMGPLMRSPYHLLSNSVWKYCIVLVQMLMPGRWLILIVHYFLRYVS